MNPGPLEYSCKVVPEEAGQRLDKFLVSRYPHYSRSRLQDWISQGYVTCDDTVITDCHYKVKRDQTYQLHPPPAVEAVPQPCAMNLDILYEDEDLLVVNKPAGLVVHPAPGHPTFTLVNALLAHCHDSLSGIGGVKRPGIVHRLDKDTSGLMVVAKNDYTHQELSKQFEPKIDPGDAERTLKRVYWGLVWGQPVPSAGVIEGFIHRHPVHRQRMAVSQCGSGRLARTHYQVKLVKYFGSNGTVKVAWVQYTLDTGRTHQIRLHSQYAGFPLIGDPLYGRRSLSSFLRQCPAVFADFKRQALHAAELHFIHPQSRQKMHFTAAPPADFNALLKELMPAS